LAKLIKEHKGSFKKIINQVENASYVEESMAEVTLSTIHKSKGREWDNVVLEDDGSASILQVSILECNFFNKSTYNFIMNFGRFREANSFTRESFGPCSKI